MSPVIHTNYLQAIAGSDEISSKRKAQLERHFQEFCDHIHFFKRLSDLKFKNEGNFSVGNGSSVTATVWTFKAWQWRLYGSILQVHQRRCFVGVNIDPSKKQNKANQQMLRDTAQKIGLLVEFWG
ncbi:hypothetical protein [Bradyrhizobium sp. SSUT77]|uniref:hypothetical protein n=1 Tax=Bradyrhizobium sp. SSUT77 TaxID=3040603 RepID=UPI00244CBCE7|nr:hypothetical protein [Bradyrhizobium sp. SSUT77]MDH2345518.1 hypothetical protein [Bradyrhizobium sp. SSUT77]